MIPSRTLVVPGMRTAPKLGRRADFAIALHLLSGRPVLWLFGALGFILRGGVLLLIVPIIVLPTQVEVRFLLGDYLGSSGLTPAFWSLIGLLTAASLGIAIAIMYVLARIGLGAFSRLVHDPSTLERRAGVRPRKLGPAQRGALVRRLFVIQAVALLLLLVAAAPLAAAIGQTTYGEIVRPSSAESIYLRVLSQVTTPLIVLIIGVVVVDAVAAVAERMLLMRAFGIAGRHTGGPLPAHLLHSAATALIGWTLIALAVIPSLLVLSAVWQATRAVFLAGGTGASVVGPLVGALLLAAVWCSVLAVTGFAAALRTALWSLGELR